MRAVREALPAIDARIQHVEAQARLTPYRRKRASLKDELISFLSALPGKPTLASVSPNDIKRFLVWKDRNGRTAVHHVSCPMLGRRRGTYVDCPCPKRLAVRTVEGVVSQLKAIFKAEGRGEEWVLNRGNPAVSPDVVDYARVVGKEQAVAHVAPNQAIPILPAKVRVLLHYMSNELARLDLPALDRYSIARDRAFVAVQFFAGDRCGDLRQMLSQEVLKLPGGSFLITHTVGKTLVGKDNRTFLLAKIEGHIMCPVENLSRYFEISAAMGLDLSNGYLFREVDRNLGGVTLLPMSYFVFYARFKKALVDIGMYEGETPHSLRAGCAVTLAASEEVSNQEIMAHIGWRGEKTAVHYARTKAIQARQAAGKLVIAVTRQQPVDHVTSMSHLPRAFPLSD